MAKRYGVQSQVRGTLYWLTSKSGAIQRFDKRSAEINCALMEVQNPHGDYRVSLIRDDEQSLGDKQGLKPTQFPGVQ